MIAIADVPSINPPIVRDSKTRQTSWHDQFADLLPAIRRHARICFRSLNVEAREEAVQATVAHALVAFTRLVESGRRELAYASPLARYGVARVRSGRDVGNSLNVQDVMSVHCQQRKGISVERLDEFDEQAGQWKGILVEDRSASPADLAATRIDFQCWLHSLTSRQRRMAEMLALGEETKAVAGAFGISWGRVSQMRRELHDAWYMFQGKSKIALVGG